MSLPVVYRRRVGQDLAAAHAWYEEQRAGLGEELLGRVAASFEAIEQFPGRFAAVHGEVRRAFVSRFPYAVFFQIEPARVVILAVLHTARDPKLWPAPAPKVR